MSKSEWLSIHGQKILFLIYVQPGAKKSEVVGIHNGRLKIRIQSPPVDGKANSTLVEFLAKTLKVSKRSIELIRGEKSREKDLEIAGYTIESIQKTLEAYI